MNYGIYIGPLTSLWAKDMFHPHMLKPNEAVIIIASQRSISKKWLTIRPLEDTAGVYSKMVLENLIRPISALQLLAQAANKEK